MSGTGNLRVRNQLHDSRGNGDGSTAKCEQDVAGGNDSAHDSTNDPGTDSVDRNLNISRRHLNSINVRQQQQQQD